LKGVESMGKLRWILVISVVLAAFSINAVAGSDTVAVMNGDATTEASAVLMAFAVMGDGVGDTAISVSNTLATPTTPIPVPLDAHLGSGFPMGSDTEGPVEFYCFDTSGTTPAAWVYNTADFPAVGGGLDADGNLTPGKTLTIFMSEIVAALTGSEDLVFAGYCYVVGNFDAMAGTYVNKFEAEGTFQAFAMSSDFTGAGIMGGDGM
jgi:hypothetical protein